MDSSTSAVNSSTTVGSDSLGTACERAGGHVVHPEAGLDLDHGRQVGRPGPGEDVAGHAGAGQRGGQLAHVDVHAAAVARAGLGQRGGVQREDGEAAHGAQSLPAARVPNWASRSSSPEGPGPGRRSRPAGSAVPDAAGVRDAGRQAPVDRPADRVRRAGRRAWAVGSPPAVAAHGAAAAACLLVLVLAAEGEVDAHQRLLLLLADGLVGHDGPGQVGRAVGRLEDAGLHVERLGRDAQRLGDLLEDLGRGPAQPALDLAQIGVGDAGQLGEPAQREPGGARCSRMKDPRSSQRSLGSVLTPASVLPRGRAAGAGVRRGPRGSARAYGRADTRFGSRL